MTRSPPARRLRVYAIVPGLIPPAIITTIDPLYRLTRRGEVDFDFGVGAHWSAAKVEAADVVVFVRSNDVSALRALRLAERLGKRVIYDIDDNFFEIPLDTPAGRQLRDGVSLAIVRRFIASAECVRVYAPLMREVIAARGGRPRLIRAWFDRTLAAPTRPFGAGPTRIAYASVRQDAPETERLLEDALLPVLDRHGGAVEVLFWREPPPRLRGHPQVRRLEPVPDYRRFLRDLAALRPAIGLAPLPGGRFFRSKSNNKYREYGGLGVAGIYARVETYEDSVVDGVTGLLADSEPAAWAAAIDRLIADPTLRQRIAAAAATDVEAHYSVEAFLAEWSRMLHDPRPAPSLSPHAAWANRVIVQTPRGAAPAVHVAQLAGFLGGLGVGLSVVTARADRVIRYADQVVRYVLVDSSGAPDLPRDETLTVADVTRRPDATSLVAALAPAAVSHALHLVCREADTDLHAVPWLTAVPLPTLSDRFNEDGTALRMLRLSEMLADQVLARARGLQLARVARGVIRGVWTSIARVRTAFAIASARSAQTCILVLDVSGDSARVASWLDAFAGKGRAVAMTGDAYLSAAALPEIAHVVIVGEGLESVLRDALPPVPTTTDADLDVTSYAAGILASTPLLFQERRRGGFLVVLFNAARQRIAARRFERRIRRRRGV